MKAAKKDSMNLATRCFRLVTELKELAEVSSTPPTVMSHVADIARCAKHPTKYRLSDDRGFTHGLQDSRGNQHFLPMPVTDEPVESLGQLQGNYWSDK